MEPRTPAEWKTLFESEAFARQTEYYGPLGVEYTPAGTHLRLWAPTAKQAAVNLPVWHLQCSGPLCPRGRGERGAQHDL